MARILFSGKWFEEVSPAAFYETDFEQLVLDHADELYEGFLTARFKTTVESDEGGAKPDMALVSRSYEEWWVVEIELAHHSLSGHVLPQVRRLSKARYGLAEADYLCAQNKALDVVRTQEMMKGKQPRVLVIVNAPCPDWVGPLNRWEACVAVVQLYQSGKNERILRINGEHPARRAEGVAQCYFEGLYPLLVVDTPAILPHTPDGRFRIYHGGKLTLWKRRDTRDQVLLVPVGANPLSLELRYELMPHLDGSLEIRALKH